jgi:hypothetical protein
MESNSTSLPRGAGLLPTLKIDSVPEDIHYGRDGDKEPQAMKLPKEKTSKLSSKDSRVLSRLGALLGKMRNQDKTLLVGVARKMSAAR